MVLIFQLSFTPSRLIIIRDRAEVDVTTIPIATTRITVGKTGSISKPIQQTIIIRNYHRAEIRINSTPDGHAKSGQAQPIQVTTDEITVEMITIVDVADSTDVEIIEVAADITIMVNDVETMVTEMDKTTAATTVQNRISTKYSTSFLLDSQ